MSIYDIKKSVLTSAYDYNGKLLNTAYDISGNTIFSGVSDEYRLNHNNCIYRGKLRKSGNYLVDQYGDRIQLRGIGLHAILQYTNLHTKEAFESLKVYGINCVRISVYLSDYSFKYSDGLKQPGYISAPEETKAEIEKIVSLCVDLGLYAIIDWHTMSDEITDGVIPYRDEAVAFFEYFAEKYANTPNVLYELQNEPYNATQDSLGTYVKAERDAIAKYVDDPVMIVGSRGGYFKNTVTYVESYGVTDVFYSQHFYSDELTIDVFGGITSQVPFICTEWSNASEAGTATGDNADACNAFMDYMYEHKISNCSWKFTDQTHVFSVLQNRGAINDSYYSNGFREEDMTAWGSLFFSNNYRYNFVEDLK